ncbi:MAG: PBP1A family penicillin-binding protein [Thermoanaerobaculia bacterium]|nr:PBP1A family penicillin-binding protein [Thermoanaerobaculia bacterium]
MRKKRSQGSRRRSDGGRSGGRTTARKGAPRRRFGRLRIALIVALAAAGAWVLWPFWHLSLSFDERGVAAPSRVYASPLRLLEGGALTAAELDEELAALGYRAVEASPDPGEFVHRSRSYSIHRRAFSAATGTRPPTRLTVELAAGRVSRLEEEGRRVGSADLEPPLLATLVGADRIERRPVALDALPEDLVHAVLAAEDAGFFRHPGLSVRGIARALWHNVRSEGPLQGGSTLTQQLVKNIYLTHERSLGRKLREAVLAIVLELRYDKRDILEAYLNEIYWGHSGGVNLVGVGAAARAYFGKDAPHLDLGESAVLAAIIRAPNRYSPLRHPEAARERRDQVLEQMHELEWIGEDELAAALAEPVAPRPSPVVVRRAAYFVDRALREVEERFAIDPTRRGGLSVLTTLSWRDQRAAEEAVDWGLEALEAGWEEHRGSPGELQAALVSVAPDGGEILAWVGGRDYGDSQFDRASRARRQTGSAFKPVVYAAALRAGAVTPSSLVDDAPLSVRLAGVTWEPANDDGEFRGWVTVRRALEESLNVPTARVALEVGLDEVLEMARDLGLESRLEPYPALALGAFEVTPEELAAVYATLAAGGVRHRPFAVRTVLDAAGRPLEGEPLPRPERVLSPQVSYLLTSVLEGVVERGTGRSLRLQGLTDRLAGKTGTTNERRDSWFAAYSPHRATLVWVGYDDNRATSLSGARAALPICGRFLWRVRPPGGYATFSRPPGVVTARVDPATGLHATFDCPETVEEVFLEGDVPQQVCFLHGGSRRGVRTLSGERLERERRRVPWWKRIFGGGKKERDDGG